MFGPYYYVEAGLPPVGTKVAGGVDRRPHGDTTPYTPSLLPEGKDFIDSLTERLDPSNPTFRVGR